MSGLDVLNAISATITILETINNLYETTRNDITLPDTFQVIGRRLPVLLHILQTTKDNLEQVKDSLSSGVCQSLQEIFDDCDKNARTLSEIFAEVMCGPMDTVSWQQRYSRIVRRLGQRTKVDRLMTEITEDVQLLVNHDAIQPKIPSQSTELDSILNELKNMQNMQKSTAQEDRFTQTFQSLEPQNIHVNNGNGPQINTHAHGGTQNFNFANMTPSEDFSFRGPLGKCLDEAPFMPPELTIARDPEHRAIDKVFHSVNHVEQRPQQQERVALGGVGGIGKTQIALHYAQSRSYETVFWLNATSETSLTSSFEVAAGLIFGSRSSRPLEGKEAVRRTREWLSHPQNSQWLLVFDNYDHPNIFTLDPYYPPAAHGAVIITSRRADLVTSLTAEVLVIKPLQTIDEGLQILQTRSKRDNIDSDPWAVQLAGRLAGLPLALATAGAFLHKRPLFTFQQYLEKYEKQWDIDPRRHVQLPEYQKRTLYTTWKMSYDELEKDDLEAATMLKALAYFDNQALWYELFRAGLPSEGPLFEMIYDHTNFHGIMATLSEYCFVEFNPHSKGWSLHNCIHDWVSAHLNKDIDFPMYWYAFDCVSQSIKNSDRGPLDLPFYLCYVPHATRLSQDRFLDTNIIMGITPDRWDACIVISRLLTNQVYYEPAERFLEALLIQTQSILGPETPKCLGLMRELGYVYLLQMKLYEAKRILEKTLMMRTKVLGQNHSLVFASRFDLGLVYRRLGDYEGAEQLYLHALFGKALLVKEYPSLIFNTLEQLRLKVDISHDMRIAWDFSDAGINESTTPILSVGDSLDAIESLGFLLSRTARQNEAELILNQAMLLRERMRGLDHPSTISLARNIGVFYQRQGKLDDAEMLFKRALSGNENRFGTNYIGTLRDLLDLGDVHGKQKRFKDAESAYTRALVGLENAFGSQHNTTIDAILRLASLYFNHAKYSDADLMYTRALALQETLCGPSDPLTLKTVARLGLLYFCTNRLEDAEKMFLRVIWSPIGPGTLKFTDANQFGIPLCLTNLYCMTGRFHDAENLLVQMLTATRETSNQDHMQFAFVSFNLATLWIEKGQFDDANNLLVEAMQALGEDSTSDSEIGSIFSSRLAEVQRRKCTSNEADFSYKSLSFMMQAEW